MAADPILFPRLNVADELLRSTAQILIFHSVYIYSKMPLRNTLSRGHNDMYPHRNGFAKKRIKIVTSVYFTHFYNLSLILH